MLGRGIDFAEIIDISDWRKIQEIMRDWETCNWRRLEEFTTLQERTGGIFELAQLFVIQRHLVGNNLVESDGEKRICSGQIYGNPGSEERFYRVMTELSLVDVLDYGNSFLNDGLAEFFDKESMEIKIKPKKEKSKYELVLKNLWRNTAYRQFDYLAEKCC